MDHGWQYTSARTTLPDETWARALAADGWTTWDTRTRRLGHHQRPASLRRVAASTLLAIELSPRPREMYLHTDSARSRKALEDVAERLEAARKQIES